MLSSILSNRGTHMSPRRSWTARPYQATDATSDVHLRQAAPSRSMARPAGVPSQTSSGDSVDRILARDGLREWNPHNAETYHRKGPQPEVRQPCVRPKRPQLLGEDETAAVHSTTAMHSYPDPKSVPGYSPREVRNPGASNLPSQPSHELFARRSDRVTKALSQTADDFQPLLRSAYVSRKVPLLAGNLFQTDASEPPPPSMGVTGEHYPWYVHGSYQSPRLRKLELGWKGGRPKEDTPRLLTHDIDLVEHGFPTHHKGFGVLTMLLQADLGEGAPQTGMARRPAGFSPRGGYVTESAQRFGWKVGEHVPPRKPPPGVGMGLIS